MRKLLLIAGLAGSALLTWLVTGRVATEPSLAFTAPVSSIHTGFDLLESLPGRTPDSMELSCVEADLAADAGYRVRGLRYFFAAEGCGRETWAEIDNRTLTVRSSDEHSRRRHPLLGDCGPLDLGSVKVDLEEALGIARRATAKLFADPRGTDLVLDLALRAEGGAPIWRVSFDHWPVAGPAEQAAVRIDARTGEIVDSPTGL